MINSNDTNLAYYYYDPYYKVTATGTRSSFCFTQDDFTPPTVR
jgi:hypothetical protein